MFVITGTGRSGTSFLASVLKRCGCEFRGGFSEKMRAGLEDPLVVSINESMFRYFKLDIAKDFLNQEQIEELSRIFADKLVKFSEVIKFVKDPRFCKTIEVWLKAGAKIDFVVICMRKDSEVVDSAISTQKEKSSLFWKDQIKKRLSNLFRVIYQYGLEFQTVWFPQDYITTILTGRLSPSLEEIAKRLELDPSSLLAAIKEEFNPDGIKCSEIKGSFEKFLLSPANFVKKERYYENPRKDFISLIPDDARHILDVGCGKGAFGREIKKKNPQCEVIGIEIDPHAAKIASLNLDKVIIGDAEYVDLKSEGFKEKYFDCIIYGDILEHLKDPWTVLYKHKRFLKDDGLIIASIPNVRNLQVVFSLINEGEWDYVDEGILDSDHLRFFTLKGIKKMFSLTGFEIIHVGANINVSPLEISSLKKSLGLTERDMNEFCTVQFIVVAKKKKKKEPLCSIIMPAFNKRNTISCIQRIYNVTDPDLFEIILIDNTFSAYFDKISEQVENFKVIHNKQNLDFVKACNQGASVAKGKYLVFLQNEKEPSKGWLEEMLNIAENEKEVGAVLFNEYMLTPKWLFDELGGLDGGFLDYSFRVKERGLRVYKNGFEITHLLKDNKAYKICKKGEQEYEKGNIESAIVLFESALKIDETCYTAYNNLAAIYWQMGDTERASYYIKKAFELAPDDPDVLWNFRQINGSIADFS